MTAATKTTALSAEARYVLLRIADGGYVPPYSPYVRELYDRGLVVVAGEPTKFYVVGKLFTRYDHVLTDAGRAAFEEAIR